MPSSKHVYLNIYIKYPTQIFKIHLICTLHQTRNKRSKNDKEKRTKGLNDSMIQGLSGRGKIKIVYSNRPVLRIKSEVSWSIILLTSSGNSLSPYSKSCSRTFLESYYFRNSSEKISSLKPLLTLLVFAIRLTT